MRQGKSEQGEQEQRPFEWRTFICHISGRVKWFYLQGTCPGADPSCKNSIICAVFEPGAAHMSRTLWWGFTSRKNGGIMLTASWREMWPFLKWSKWDAMYTGKKEKASSYHFSVLHKERMKLAHDVISAQCSTWGLHVPTIAFGIPVNQRK